MSQQERLIARAADKIGGELAKLAAQLPESVAPQVVMELLGIEIARREPTLAAWLGLQGEGVETTRPLAVLLEERRLRAPRDGDGAA